MRRALGAIHVKKSPTTVLAHALQYQEKDGFSSSNRSLPSERREIMGAKNDTEQRLAASEAQANLQANNPGKAKKNFLLHNKGATGNLEVCRYLP